MASKLRKAGLALVSILAFFVTWTVAVRLFWHGGLGLDAVTLMAIKAVVWLGFAWWWARQAEPSSPLRAMGLTKNLAAGIGVGALVGLLLLAKDAVRVWWFEGRWARIPADWLWAGASPAIEEIAFRGALLALLQRFMGFWPANVLTALLFVTVHLPGWWAAGLLSRRSLLWEVAVLLVLSLLFGWLRRRAVSTWAAVLPHWANNLGARL